MDEVHYKHFTYGVHQLVKTFLIQFAILPTITTATSQAANIKKIII